MRTHHLLLAFLLVAASARDAAAQLCHLGPLDPGDPHEHEHHHEATRHVEVSVSTLAATADGGSFQGAGAAVSWHRDRVGVYAAMFGYRMAQDDRAETFGVGDAVVQASLRLAGRSWGHVGAVAVVGLPTGHADEGLGMGHAMAMGGVWGAARVGRTTMLVTVVAGSSLGADDHQAHMHGINVNPMNPSEIGGTARTAVVIGDRTDLYALASAGVPIGDGVVRAAAGAGASWRAARWSVAGEMQVGVAGDPFRLRGIVTLGRCF